VTIRKQSLNVAINAFVDTDVKTYVDVGHSNWVGASEMASRLSTIEIAKTKGISVNVSNFQTNESSKAYASSVLAGLNNGALRAVVDSSRNGVGPPSNNQWCNALGRKVGTSSSITQDGIVDAYLWIKVPGESDGTGANCSNGTSEGSFWLEYALGLVD
jgi:endoglucanase